MKTREEAISQFNAAGLFARPHDLWLGAAIVVSRPPREIDGIHVLDGNLFIHTDDAGSWCITRTQHGGQSQVDVYPSLDAAVSAARLLIEGAGTNR